MPPALSIACPSSIDRSIHRLSPIVVTSTAAFLAFVRVLASISAQRLLILDAYVPAYARRPPLDRIERGSRRRLNDGGAFFIPLIACATQLRIDRPSLTNFHEEAKAKAPSLNSTLFQKSCCRFRIKRLAAAP